MQAEAGRRIGVRLRSIRQQKQLSLSDVERISGGDLGTSTIGAYERGDRTITVHRLERLAGFYGVPIEQLLPQPVGHSAITTRTSPIADVLTINIPAVANLSGAKAAALLRFIDLVRERRTDPHPDLITLRGADSVVIAAIFDVDIDKVTTRLEALGVRAKDPARD